MKWIMEINESGYSEYRFYSQDEDLAQYVDSHRFDACGYINWIALVGVCRFREGSEYWSDVYWRIHRLLGMRDEIQG